MDLQRTLDVAVNAAQKAAEIILTAINIPRVADYKGKTNLVTKTDKESEQVICDIIHEEFPDHGILAEESDSSLQDAEYQWIIHLSI